ncbi:43035_t:CDS:2 [Gigaspora margarita]|uniref:43035_t:CDS:1 n=1 Tax=Gigaspora margarita TaxID=4874 RepID=A0ABM8VZQ2_GIGMA|nr:43035_t:CDS:2 [Gigaspora margarita]
MKSWAMDSTTTLVTCSSYTTGIHQRQKKNANQTAHKHVRSEKRKNGRIHFHLEDR